MKEFSSAEQLEHDSANEENLARLQSHRLHELAFNQHDPRKFEAISEAARILADEGENGAEMSLVALENGNSWDDALRDEALAIRRLDSSTFIDFDDASEKIRSRVVEYRASEDEDMRNEANALQYSLANIDRGDVDSARNLLRILENNLASYALPGMERTNLLRQEVAEIRSLRDAIYVKTKELEMAETRKKAEDDQAVESEIAASIARDSVDEAFEEVSTDKNEPKTSNSNIVSVTDQEIRALEEINKKEQEMSEADRAYSRQISRLAGEGLIDVSNSALARELADALDDGEKIIIAQDLQVMYRKYFDERVEAKTSRDAAVAVSNFKSRLENLSHAVEVGDYFRKDDEVSKENLSAHGNIDSGDAEQTYSAFSVWTTEAPKDEHKEIESREASLDLVNLEQADEARTEAIKQFVRNSMAKVPKQLLIESVRKARPDLRSTDAEALTLLSEALDSIDHEKYIGVIRNNGFHESNGGFWEDSNPNSMVGKIASDARSIVDRIVSDSLAR